MLETIVSESTSNTLRCAVVAIEQNTVTVTATATTPIPKSVPHSECCCCCVLMAHSGRKWIDRCTICSESEREWKRMAERPSNHSTSTSYCTNYHYRFHNCCCSSSFRSFFLSFFFPFLFSVWMFSFSFEFLCGCFGCSVQCTCHRCYFIFQPLSYCTLQFFIFRFFWLLFLFDKYTNKRHNEPTKQPTKQINIIVYECAVILVIHNYGLFVSFSLSHSHSHSVSLSVCRYITFILCAMLCFV